MNKQNCPLCDREAEYSLHDGNKRKKFYCPYCKVFVITDTAERKLSTVMSTYKSDISEASRKLSDEFLMHISVPSIETGRPLDAVQEPRANW